MSFWWTMGVNQSHEGVRAGAGDHRPRADDRQHRPPGHGRELDHRPVQRDGLAPVQQHHQPARRPRLHQRRSTARRSPACSASTRRASRASRAGPTTRSWRGSWRGKIRGLWIVATNTAHSWINQADATEVLGRLDFLVVQDMYATTETVAHAHIVLPAAGWGEKEGTFINSERRIGLLKKVARAPGRGAGRLLHLPADRRGVGLRRHVRALDDARGRCSQILKELSRGQPCDITGIADYGMLEDRRGIQWPLREGEDVAPQSERRLFEDGRFFHADGKARFIFEEPRAVPEPTDARYPFALLTGRGSSSQWHTQTRTAKSALLRKLVPVAAVRRDQPGRRAHAGPRRRTSGSSSNRGAARCARAPTRPRRAARAAVHPDALRRRRIS